MATNPNNPQEVQGNGKQPGNGSWLNPFDYLPNFSLFSVFWLGLLGLGAYFLGFTDRGKGMLNQFIEMLPESWQSTIAGWLLPKEVNQAVNADPETFTRVKQVVKEAGGDPVNQESWYATPVIFSLMMREPQVVQKLITALPAEGATGANAADKEKADKIRSAVRGIVGNPQMLATLFDDSHRAGTLAIIEAMGRRYAPYLPEGRVSQFIERTGLQDGRPTVQLTRLLNAMLVENETQRQAALGQFISEVPRAERQRLLEGADPSKAPEGQRAALDFIQNATDRELTATTRLEQNLAARKIDFKKVLGATNTPSEFVGFMLNPKHRELLTPEHGLIGAIFQERAGRTPERKPDGSLNGERVLSGFLGTMANVNGQPGQLVNMNVMIQFFREVGNNPHNQKEGVRRAHHVITGMLSLMAGDREAAAQLDAGQVAAFFANQGNVDAFKRLLDRASPEKLPRQPRLVFEAMRAHWSGRADGQHISEVMAHPESVAMLINGIRESLTNPNAKPTIISDLSGFERWYGQNAPSWAWQAPPSEIGENLQALEAVQNALIGAGVIRRPTPARG